VLLGRVEPRLWTPPLRELTPETSYGFDVIDFARDVLDEPLDPWQEWVAIHAGELLEDGTPRFKKVLIIVARQSGKTHLCKVLSLYWLAVEECKLVLGMSTSIGTAREPWEAACELARTSPWIPYDKTRQVNGEETLFLKNGTRYRIAASNRQGGRGLSIDRLIVDELREHRTWDAWNAAEPATRARRGSQIFCITNQGDEEAIVLDSLRLPAVKQIETGEVIDARLGLFEYSAPMNIAPDSVEAIAMANPNAGHRLDFDVLITEARKAVAAGGAHLAGFRTETLCQRVDLVDPAIDPMEWEKCKGPLRNLQGHRLAFCLDVSPEMNHATLMAASRIDEKVWTSVVKSWDGPGCLSAVRRELPDLVRKFEPKVIGWFPGGPAAALGAELEKRTGARRWPPAGVKAEELRAEQVTRCCMGLAEFVLSGHLVHPGDPLINAHIAAAKKTPMGDGWRFDRKGSMPIDAAYALAGAVHLRRTMKEIVPLKAL
jgi:hypothetical protein